MRPRFQADADLNHKIVVGLRRRERSIDILSASEVGRFVELQSSSGLIIIPQRLDIGSAIEDLLLIWSTTVASEWEYQRFHGQ
ncbi:MAG: hypothetical protein ABI824_02555 [Acidobacteriota bacterium]